MFSDRYVHVAVGAKTAIAFVPTLQVLDLVLSLLVFDSFSAEASSAAADLLVVGGRQLPLPLPADWGLPPLEGQPFDPRPLLHHHGDFYHSSARLGIVAVWIVREKPTDYFLNF